MEHAPPFVAVISHSVTNTPLSYISPKNTSLVPGSDTLRVPTEDGEDSWCLYAKAKSNTEIGREDVDWLLAESVDKLDTRWG